MKPSSESTSETTSEPSSVKLSEVIEAFWNDRSSTWKLRSLADYESCKRNLLDYFDKDTQVHELNYYRMKKYRDQLKG